MISVRIETGQAVRFVLTGTIEQLATNFLTICRLCTEESKVEDALLRFRLCEDNDSSAIGLLNGTGGGTGSKLATAWGGSKGLGRLSLLIPPNEGARSHSNW